MPGLFRDDAIVLLFDTFLDRRNAYFFETNANSSRTDGLVTDEGRDFNVDWDTIWDVACRVHDGGWTAEFAIPFSSLRFDPRLDTWGFQGPAPDQAQGGGDLLVADRPRGGPVPHLPGR